MLRFTPAQEATLAQILPLAADATEHGVIAQAIEHKPFDTREIIILNRALMVLQWKLPCGSEHPEACDAQVQVRAILSDFRAQVAP